MSNFKLLAIRPTTNCHKKFTKILKPNKVYKFYNNYIFNHENENEDNAIISIIKQNSIPSDFFSLKKFTGSLQSINISAVVGENGSGKSSLIELLFASVYLFSTQEKIILKNFEDQSVLEDIDKQIKEKEEQIKQLQQNKIAPPYEDYKTWIIGNYIKERNLESEISILKGEENSILNLQKQYTNLKNDVRVDFFYEINDNIYNLKISDKIELFKFQQNENKWLSPELITITPSNNFFYSIILNYSHYALNSKEIGEWASELFHKNDGYQTPIVINPMRIEGNIDINKENHLVRSRLLALILTYIDEKPIYTKEERIRNSTRSLISGKIAKKIKIEIDNDKFRIITNRIDQTVTYSYPYIEQYEKKYWKLIEETFFKDADSQRIPTNWDKHAKEYILNKLMAIAEKYSPYQIFDLKNDFSSFLEAIDSDDSHITFKLYQAINFLKFNYAIEYQNSDNIDNISKILSTYTYKYDLIKIVPPSFLKIDILFSDIDETDSLNNLSSGEKQKVYSTSSLIYHLLYLDSVKQSETLKHKYTNVNIIFDEIELYYHPELQRRFIFDLITAISNTTFKYLQNINCLFVTHAPFILSDIPKSNVLSLQIDNNKQHALPKEITDTNQSFASNVHTMLISNFFMKATIGEFAKHKIDNVVVDLANIIRDMNGDKIDSIEIAKKRALFKEKEPLLLIKTIGDNIVKEKLLQMYYLAIEDNEVNALIKFHEDQMNNLKHRL